MGEAIGKDRGRIAPVIDFWYEFASTYSYLTALRIERAASARNVGLRWRPFLLGPVFAKAGWPTSPFNLYPAKGAYMWRDMERLTAAAGLPFVRPDPFPQNGLLAARVALALDDPAAVSRFSRAVYLAEFGEGRDIGARETIAAILAGLDLSADALLARAETPGIKARLKDEVTAAECAGIFGAPSFTTADGDLFWGNDRLEQALDHAVRHAGADAAQEGDPS